ncbi:hypothetical protein MD484_g8602, partial [Candolleomyces efflorescens]
MCVLTLAFRKGQFIPWSNARGQGPWGFSLWGKLVPDLNASLALAAIRFQESGNFVNPSRAQPQNLQLRDVPAKTPRFHLMRNYKPVICVACGLVLKANLETPLTHYMRQKQIHILFHGQEWERNVGWSWAVLGEETLLAPVFMDGMQMTTKTDTPRENGSKSKAIGYNPNPAPQPEKDGFVLSTSSEVPVYDARNTQSFNFNTDLPHLADRLPKWTGGEIPKGSCAVVGYTMAKYMSNKGHWSLGCNIHWVMVLGLPDPDVVHTLVK